MKKDNEKRNYIIAAIVLVVILSLISILDRTKPSDTAPQFVANTPAVTDSQTDPKASSEIMSEVVDQQQIEDEVKKELDTGQPVTMPDVPDSTLILVPNSASSVASYVTTVTNLVNDYNKNSEDITKRLFDDSTKASEIETVLQNTRDLLNALYATSVPKDAAAFHKAVIQNYTAYTALIGTAKDYNLKLNSSPWKEVYNEYAVITNASNQMQNEFDKLKKNYNIQ